MTWRAVDRVLEEHSAGIIMWCNEPDHVKKVSVTIVDETV